MPKKSWFAALLAFALFAAQGRAQQPFDSSSFGAELVQRVTARSSRSGEPRSERATVSPGRASPELVLPAVYESPDRDLRTLQQAEYTTPPQTATSNDASPLSQETSDSPAAPPETAELCQSPARSDSDFCLPLARPEKKQPGAKSASPSGKGLQAALTVISSLALVLGLFFVTAWCLRRTGAGGLATLPSDVFETLGRAPLTNRQQVHLLRWGSKLLLVSVTPDGAETLAEIDDPDEVVRLTGLCKANHAGSAAVAFRQVLRQFAKEPAEPGFVGRTEPDLPHAHRPSELENLHG